jgi:uncharacterized RmlC-like cupin family protein
LKRLLRQAFYELFAYVKGVDVLGPTTVRELPTDSPYQAWLQQVAAEVPLHAGTMIEDVAAVPLRPWPQQGEGVRGLYLRFADYQILDGRILEIPVSGTTTSRRLFYEQAIYCIEGSGGTVLQQEGAAEQRVEWQQGDLFCVPLNVRHRHFSAGAGPARLLAVTSFPLVLNTFGSADFVHDNPCVFRSRYDGSPDYFTPVEDSDGLAVNTHFTRDIRRVKTRSFDYRGHGNTTIRYLMAGNTMLNIHVSEMPSQAYKKAHRQSGEAFVLMLSGEGFSLAWPEGAQAGKRRVDWRAGTLFSPPFYWYHQNLNPNPAPARYLAINTPTLVRNLGLRFSDQLEVDDAAVKAEWARELAKPTGRGL